MRFITRVAAGCALLLPWLAGAQATGEFGRDTPRLVAPAAEAGLPNPVVSALAEDQEGLLWLGTARGAVRFDGHHFRSYGNHWSSSAGEISLFVRSLLAAGDGTVWVGTDFVGLAFHDPERDRLVPVALGDDLPVSYSVNTLAEGAGGTLWVGTDGLGLIERQPDGRTRRWVQSDGSGLAADRILSLLHDREGLLWVGTSAGLVVLVPDRSRFEVPDPALGNVPVSALLQGRDGQVWVGARDGRLWRLSNPASGPRVATRVREGEGTAAVHVFLQPDEKTLWVGSEAGVRIRSAADGRTLQWLRHVPGNPYSLAGDEVRALLHDRGGQIWVGGYGGGVQRHNPLNPAMQVLDRHVFAKAGDAWRDPNVRSIVVLQDGRTLLGTHDLGVLILDRDLTPVGVLRDDQGNVAFDGVRVTGLGQSVDGALWIGSDAGIFRQAHEGGKLERFENLHGRVRRIFADPRGDVWFGTEGGVLRHRAGSGELVPVVDEGKGGGWRDVNALGMDSQGRVWVGGDGGLAVLATPGGRLRRVAARHQARGNNTDVLGLLIDADDSIWFDTPSGLFRLHPDRSGEGRVEALSERFGYAGEPFGANLLRDAQGRLWTQAAVLDPLQERMRRLGEADGIDIGLAWFRAYAQHPDGRLLFGGMKGLLVVDPSRYRFTDYEPPLVITSVRINGRPSGSGRGLSQLELQPGQRSLALGFSALDYSAPERLAYRYRLIGEDDDWIEVGSRQRVATYSNLVPGSYRFELRASDRHGHWAGRVRSVAITVQPAWWQTWWARGAAILGALGLVLFMIQMRTRWLRTRRRVLEHSVALRTRELERVSAALREKSAALEEASLTDPLTGLRNRRYFLQEIDAEIERAQHLQAGRDGQASATAFILLDIDHFKRVNDGYGHAAGDAVLVQVAERIRGCLREGDSLIRWGGEEFLLLARDLTCDEAIARADRIVRAVGGQVFELPDRRSLRCTCSLGYAALPLQARWPHQASWEEVVELADLALLAVKRSGRNGWLGVEVVADEPLAPGWLRRFSRAVRREQVRLRSSLDLATVEAALQDEPVE